MPNPAPSPSVPAHPPLQLVTAPVSSEKRVTDLPAEILYQIFRHVFFAAACRFSSLIRLRNVCRYWFYLVLNETRLWRIFAPFSDKRVPLVQFALERNPVERPVDILYNHRLFKASNHAQLNLVSFMTANISRVSQLHFRSDSAPVVFALKKMFAKNMTLPGAVSFNIEGTGGERLEECVLIAPLLRIAYFSRFFTLPRFAECDNLTELVIMSVGTLPDHLVEALTRVRLSVLHLAVTNMETFLKAAQLRTSPLTLPTVKNLTIQTAWHALVRFFAFVRGLQAVTHIRLRAEYSESVPDTVGPTHPGVQAIVDVLRSVFTPGALEPPEEIYIMDGGRIFHATLAIAPQTDGLQRHVALESLDEFFPAQLVLAPFVARLAELSVPTFLHLALSDEQSTFELDPVDALNVLAPVKALKLSGEPQRVEDVLDTVSDPGGLPVSLPACVVIDGICVNEAVIASLHRMARPGKHRYPVVIEGDLWPNIREQLDRELYMRVTYRA